MYDIYYHPDIQNSLKRLNLGIQDYPWAIYVDQMAALLWGQNDSRSTRSIKVLKNGKIIVYKMSVEDYKAYELFKSGLCIKMNYKIQDQKIMIGHIVEIIPILLNKKILNSDILGLVDLYKNITYTGQVSKYTDNHEILEEIFSSGLELIISDKIRNLMSDIDESKKRIQSLEHCLNEEKMIFVKNIQEMIQRNVESSDFLKRRIENLEEDNKNLNDVNNKLILIQNKIILSSGLIAYKIVFDNSVDILEYSFRGGKIPESCLTFISENFKNIDEPGYDVYYLTNNHDLRNVDNFVGIIRGTSDLNDYLPKSGTNVMLKNRGQNISVAFLKVSNESCIMNISPNILTSTNLDTVKKRND